MENGGPAPEGITDKIYENTKTIKEYFIAEDLPDVLHHKFPSLSLSLSLYLMLLNFCVWFHLSYCSSQFKIRIQVDISAEGVTSFAGPEGQFDVEVFDSASDYVKLMK